MTQGCMFLHRLGTCFGFCISNVSTVGGTGLLVLTPSVGTGLMRTVDALRSPGKTSLRSWLCSAMTLHAMTTVGTGLHPRVRLRCDSVCSPAMNLHAMTPSYDS